MSYIIDSVVADGITTEYIKFGSGKRAFVILPGLSVQSVIPAAAAVEKQYGMFKDGFSVYLFDRRKTLPTVYSVTDMANDTASAMKSLGIDSACVFGASQGGMIAITLAINHPELVGKLALGSTAARIDKKRAAVIREWINLAKESKPEELYLSFGERVYPEAVFRQYRDFFISTAKSVTDEELQRFITLAEGTAGFDITDKLNKIRCPVFVLGDTDDAVLGADATLEIAEALNGKPDFNMYMYSGYGHAAYDTAPDYPQRLFDFLAD